MSAPTRRAAPAAALLSFSAAAALLSSGCCLSLDPSAVPDAKGPEEGHALRDELAVTCIPPSELPRADDPRVIAIATGADGGGTTSIRLETDPPEKENSYPVHSATVFGDRDKYPQRYARRDRDLGQTFLTGDAPVKLDAIYLKVGPNGGDPNAAGAAVAIQLFEVSGSPVLNDHGTPGFAGMFDRARSAELDDYLEGETFRSIAVARGTLPAEIGAHAVMKWDLSGRSEIALEPHRCYAFLVMLLDPKPRQQLSLANNYYGSYAPDPGNRFVGHGIRREGTPRFATLDERLRTAPGTLGFPDVCTWRDYFFIVTGKPAD